MTLGVSPYVWGSDEFWCGCWKKIMEHRNNPNINVHAATNTTPIVNHQVYVAETHFAISFNVSVRSGSYQVKIK
jgi:hypothetical protein